MPCTSDIPSDYAERELRKECNSLQAALCSTQRLLLSVVDNKAKKISTNDQQAILDVRNAYRKHRENDKRKARKKAEEAVEELREDVKKIHKLGGATTKAMKLKLKDAYSNVVKIIKSDPLNTDLY